MNLYFVTFQFLLLLPSVPLAWVSTRTSRAKRPQHNAYMAAAALLGMGAGVLAVLSLSLAMADEEPIDPLLSFLPPLATLLLCAMILRRGMSWRVSRSGRGGTGGA